MPNGPIPEVWVRAKISDVSIKGLQRKPAKDESFDYVDIGSIDRNLKKISDPQVISGDNAPSRARKVIEKGDVLVSLTRPNLNAVALVDQKYHKQIASTGFEVIKPVLVDSRYIFALVRSKDFVDQISGVVQGALYPAAKSSDVQSFEFPLPPLAEQKVIADKLDTLLAQVQNTKARLERIPQILKRLRQSVLAAAVSGRLTEEWRHFEEYKTRVVSLSDVISSAQIGLVRSAKEQVGIASNDQSVPYLKMNNIDNDWGVLFENVVFVQCDHADFHKYQLKEGDWLFNTRNSSELVGKSCVWKGAPGYIYNNNILRVRLKEGYLTEYLEVYFRSPEGQSSLGSIKSATTSVAAIYQKQLLKQLIPFPNIDEQSEIVRRVDELFSHADRIEQQVNNALARVNSLSQSILAKAFRGELTEEWRKDNPELISGENSAEALLERIKAARSELKPTKRISNKSVTA